VSPGSCSRPGRCVGARRARLRDSQPPACKAYHNAKSVMTHRRARAAAQDYLPPAVQDQFLAAVAEFVLLPWREAARGVLADASQGGTQVATARARPGVLPSAPVLGLLTQSRGRSLAHASPHYNHPHGPCLRSRLRSSAVCAPWHLHHMLGMTRNVPVRRRERAHGRRALPGARRRPRTRAARRARRPPGCARRWARVLAGGCWPSRARS